MAGTDVGDEAANPTGPRGDQVEAIIASVREVQRTRGHLPSERDLAEALNVKRHQLRKALKSMRSLGEVEAPRDRKGAAAMPRFGEELVQLTNPIEVLELRLMMEPALARVASIRGSAVDIARIVDAATTPAGTAAGQADLAFHFAVMRAARNQLASELYKMMRQVGYDVRIKIARGPSQTCPKRIAMRDAEHLAVAQAIARRDPDAAEAAMRAHLLSVQKQFNEFSNTGTFAA